MTSEGRVEKTQGTPQGGIASPILSNIYLHFALDVWFEDNYARKGGVISRYADDVVFTFTEQEEANRFYDEVKEQLLSYNLEISEEKSHKIDFSSKSGNIFNFVGFTFFWGTERGCFKKSLKVKTKRERLNVAIRNVNTWLQENRNRYNTEKIWNHIKSILRGHYNYFGVDCNRPKLVHFYYEVNRLLFKWLNRRSQRKSINGAKFKRMLLRNPLPFP